jgi:hypothetical protein
LANVDLLLGNNPAVVKTSQKSYAASETVSPEWWESLDIN